MKRAVLVGIDDYDNFSNLGGCVADVKALAPLLEENEDDRDLVNFGVEAITTDHGPVGRDTLMQAVQRCFAPGPDVALFYFSGHGSDGGGSDVALCASDGSSTLPGVQLSDIMAVIAKSKVKQCFVVLDCCFAGSGNLPQFGVEGKFLPLGTTVLAASRGDQVALEMGGRGRFTSLLCAGLEGAAANIVGRVTAASLYAYLESYAGVFDQFPVYATNVDRLVHLRTAEPDISPQDIRRLAAHFVDVYVQFPLSPEFEDTVEGHDPDKADIFKLLQRARAVKLVRPVGFAHMYDAAMQSGSCELTPLGRHYCELVHQRKPL